MTVERSPAVGGEVPVDGVPVELRHLLDGCFQGMMTLVPAIANDQGQAQVLIVKAMWLRLGDAHDLLVGVAGDAELLVGVAGDAELLGLLLFSYLSKHRI